MEKEPVYKICVLGKSNAVKEIIVFSRTNAEEMPEIYFSESEQAFIESGNIPVRYSQQRIHKDDSVSAIKNKLLKEFEFAVAYHELYLFSNIKKTHGNLQVIFDSVARNADYIGVADFQQLLVNLGISEKAAEIFPETKRKFFLDDLYSLESAISDDSTYYKIPIGKSFRMGHNPLFSADPYDIIEGTKIIQASTNPLESFENQLLLNNNGAQFIQNVIYVCFAEDVFEYCDSIGFDTDTAAALYFPLLRRKQIIDADILLDKRRELLAETKKMVSKRTFDTYETVDLFYDIFDTRMSELKIKRGADIVSFVIHPATKHILPLDIIFKNVHSTKTIPFIKYNPGTRRENIYRFYSENITKYGTKIPFLPARTIIKLAKETGKNKQISFSVESPKGDFYINIQNNGDIQISGNNFREPMDIAELNDTLKSIANPIISHINDFLKRNGYELKMFEDIRQPEIEIEYMHYVFMMKITKEIDMAKYANCLTPIFEMDGEEPDISKGINMRFKRVENYSEMNEEEIFISALFGQKKSREEIVGTLTRKYDTTLPEAAVRIAQFLRDHEQQQGRFVKTSVRIAESPGFAVMMQIKSYDDTFVCELEMDNSTTDIHIEYLDSFFIYVDGLLRITQEPKSMGISAGKITKICQKKQQADVSTKQFDNVLTGIDAVDVGLMVYDAYEEDEENAKDYGAFGNLDDYETVDIMEDVENISLSPIYEESLSSILEDESAVAASENSESESEKVKKSKSKSESLSSKVEESKTSSANSLMYGEEEQKESNTSSANSLMYGEEEQKESNTSSANSLMYGEEEQKESNTSSANSLMYGEEEEEEVSESPKKREKGGGPKTTKSKAQAAQADESTSLKKTIDGMVLKENNDNIFLSKMKRREPTLFLSEDDGKYSAYSKLCQASQSRQPVLLTPEEKQRIDDKDAETGSSSYTNALEYGSDPENKNFYICPRYWCLKTNSPISEADVEAGKCGKVIDKGDKVVKPGHYVVEFNNKLQHTAKDGTYLQNTPGFLEGKLHPKGLCMPCCFKKAWDSKDQVNRRKECNKAPGEQPEAMEESKVKKRPAKQDTYIYEIRRYPIPPKRWGFLPISVQFFLQTDNGLSVNPDNTKYLRDDRPTNTLLRYGVENSAKKSFIAVVADIYAYTRKIPDVPPVETMCQIIARAVSIDLFLKYHNGSLAAIFKPPKIEIDELDPTKYESSVFMSRLDQGNETHLEFIYDTIAAYENFLTFLENPDSYIDHTYLWDIVCSPNPALIPKGCNLAILRIKEVDLTDDIELLCPTSVYSSVLYDIRKESVVLIKHDEYYEPVYLFKNQLGGQPLVIQKTFVEDLEIANVKIALEIIRNSIQTACLPKSSLPPNSGMPKTYKFARSPPAESLQTTLLKYKFVIRAQILNYQGKVIGFWIKYKEGGIYIPCFPSSQIPDIPLIFMDDPKIWLSYSETIKLLGMVYTKSQGEILCRPVFKVLEDNQVVGVLSETNQFIMFSDPAAPEDDGIPVIYDENYIIADKELAQNKKPDPIRTEIVKMISLETQFFGAFRTTVRILLNQPRNKVYKRQIADMIENLRQFHKNKLAFIQTILRKICDEFVSFKEFDRTALAALGEISDCFLNPAEKSFCAIQSAGKYKLLLPKANLVSQTDNSTGYFARMADELIRYKRIHLFMMNSNTYLNITNTEYKINPDEMLMLESLLTPDYFKSLEPYEHGNTMITFETANPILTQKYSNEISQKAQEEMSARDVVRAQLEDKLGIECIQLIHPITGKKATSEWKRFFSDKSTESDLFKTVKCSYYPIIYVYYEVNGIFLTTEKIKSVLISEYGKYGQFLEKVLKILRKQGKKVMIEDIYKGKYTLEEAIISEVYFLTTLDIWVLANSLSLPIVLFHQKKLKNLLDSVNWLKTNGTAPATNGKYYFVRVPTEPDLPGKYLPQYSIVKPAITANSAEIIKLFTSKSPSSMIPLHDYFEKIDFRPAAASVQEVIDEVESK